MDTSETYIKMCDCKEIQRLWQPQEGDWFWVRGRNTKGDLEVMCLSALAIKSDYNTVSIPTLGKLHCEFKKNTEIPPDMPMTINQQTYTRFHLSYFVWLPRQDQLQGMVDFKVGTFKDNFWTCLDELHKFAFTEKFDSYIPLSMEQLWLAFGMSKNFGKVWNGTGWNRG